jgi:2,3-bisphosphoglycerate-dependent phosphoglycerate mutase
MPTLVIIRHGQSSWNLENRFTGEVDVPLTEEGRAEAHQAGKKLAGYIFSKAFTSMLTRAWETLAIVLKETGQPDLPILKDKALNERNYGRLQGLNKAETALKYGDHQVEIWRRSFDTAPPGGESLQDTAARVIPYYENHIQPLLSSGENILIVAHGNSLRALMMKLEHIPPEKIPGIDLPTGQPRVYSFDNQMHLEEAKYL